MSDTNAKPARVSSPARVEANRRNAQKSTGPKTPEGKAASRGNAVTHGLRCEVIEPECQRELIDARADEWAADLRPADAAQAWLVRRAAAASVRLDLCMEAEIERRAAVAERAAAKYLELARYRAGKLGEGLALAPVFTVERLEATAAGCAWLVEQIASKVRKLDRPEASLPSRERRQALHLLGLDPETLHRDPKHPVVGPFMRAALAIDPEPDPAEADFWTGLDTSKLSSLEARRAAHAPRLPFRDAARRYCQSVLARRVEELEDQRAELEAIEVAPALATLRRRAALNSVGSKTNERLRRYESGHALDLHRSLNALAKLRRDTPGADASPAAWASAPAPNEPNDDAPTPPAPTPPEPNDSPAPNEAKPAEPIDGNSGVVKTWGTPSATGSTPAPTSDAPPASSGGR